MAKIIVSLFLLLPFTIAGLAQSILGGSIVSQGDFPWMGTIVTEENNCRCGVTLISEYWVLTAGHCAESIGAVDGDHILLNATVRDLSALPVSSEFIPIKNYFVHEEYNLLALSGPDIALIRLLTPSSFLPINLANPAEAEAWEHGNIGHVMGWGRTHAAGEVVDELQKVACHFIGDEQCADFYEASVFDPNYYELNVGGNICAGFYPWEDPAGAARGDSGGPLFYYDADSVIQQVGIVSGGEQSVTTYEYPGVYTLIPEYLDWITWVMSAYETTNFNVYNMDAIKVAYAGTDVVRISGLSAFANYNIAVYDMLGACVYSANVESQDNFTLNAQGNLLKGMYLVRIVDVASQNRVTRKIVL